MQGFRKVTPSRDELKLIVNTVLAVKGIRYGQMYGDTRKTKSPGNIDGRILKWFLPDFSSCSFKKFKKALKKALPPAYTVVRTSSWRPIDNRYSGFKLIDKRNRKTKKKTKK